MASFIAPAPTSTPRKTLPPGNYVARCFQMVMLGTHQEEFKGEKKTVFKIWIGWEFPTKMDVFQEDKGPQPYTMGKEYSFFMNDKANFRKDLESWRGQKFTEEQAKSFDAGKLLGKPCLINVQSYTKGSGELGVKIGGISPMVEGMVCPDQINPTQALSFDDFKQDLFDALPKFLKEKISISPEYKKMNEPVYQSQTVDQQAVDDLFEENDKPVPF